MKLSIVTINRNDAEGLRKTIESVVNQTFSDFEYIIIDGASTDESVDIIEQHADKITYWISEPDKGIYNAMNKGITKATGEYCLFLNSGDFLKDNFVLENSFKKQFREDIVYGSILMSDGVFYEYPDECDISLKYFINATLPHPCTFIKSSLFEKIGYYDEELKIVSDWEFFLLAICKFNVSIKKINLTVSIFELDGISSIPANLVLIADEKRKIFEKFFPRIIGDYQRFSKIEKKYNRIKMNFIFSILNKILNYKFNKVD